MEVFALGTSSFPSHDSSLPVHRFRVCYLLANTSICMSSARGAAGAVKPKLHNVNSIYAGKNQNAVKAPGMVFFICTLCIFDGLRVNCTPSRKQEYLLKSFSVLYYFLSKVS